MQDLRIGLFDVLIGVNLLREGLGFTGGVFSGHFRRGQRGLFKKSALTYLKPMGRAARNVNGRAILYADKMTKSMQKTMDASRIAEGKSKLHYNAKERHYTYWPINKKF